MNNGNAVQDQILISIRQIKDIDFFANQSIDLKPEESSILFENNINFNFKDDYIEFFLTVIYKEKQRQEEFLRYKCSTSFNVVDLGRFKSKEEGEKINFPEMALASMLGITLSHARALLAKNASGTKFAQFYLPIINPTDMLRTVMKEGAPSGG